MDYQNEKQAFSPENPEILRKYRRKVGSKELKKALLKGTALAVFLARDADPFVTEPLADLCAAQDVPCTWVPTMAELGEVCGIEVGAAAAAAVRN